MQAPSWLATGPLPGVNRWRAVDPSHLKFSHVTAPFFHEASRTVRFWVQVDAQWIGASIGKETLHYRYRPDGCDEDPMETYQSHAEDIEAAFRRRLAQGAREPVMLREFDLPVACELVLTI